MQFPSLDLADCIPVMSVCSSVLCVSYKLVVSGGLIRFRLNTSGLGWVEARLLHGQCCVLPLGGPSCLLLLLWPIGAYLGWLPNPFDIALLNFGSFFALWCDKLFLIYCVHFLPQTWNQGISQGEGCRCQV